jgi:hypothetical protein
MKPLFTFIKTNSSTQRFVKNKGKKRTQKMKKIMNERN